MWLAAGGAVAAAVRGSSPADWFPALRGRGPVVALTAVLVAGIPGLVMDGAKSVAAPNGGAYPTIALPKSRVDAARWVRDHSDPDDVLATNAHCISGDGAAVLRLALVLAQRLRRAHRAGRGLGVRAAERPRRA